MTNSEFFNTLLGEKSKYTKLSGKRKLYADFIFFRSKNLGTTSSFRMP